MKSYNLYINGEFVTAENNSTYQSTNPFNQEVIAEVAWASPADAVKAISAARTAFDNGSWSGLSREARSGYLKAISDKINERGRDLTMLEVEDSGSTLKKAKEDIFLSARTMNYYSKLALKDLTEPLEEVSKAGISRNILVHEPVGVVAAIIPWNFPLKMAVWKLGPALAAGCTVVLKPSPETPCTAFELAKICDEVGIPKGVVNVITGDAEVGETLVSSPLVDKVAFTGSTVVGQKIMSLASTHLTKLTLECGGKSANIILEDADMDIAIDGAIYAMFYHSGQCCEAGTRLLLQKSIHDEFLEKMIAKLKRLKIGDPREKTTDIGPVISKRQHERILQYIETGKKEGATLTSGGGIPQGEGLENGYFIEPTIFTNVANTMTIAQEEIFGPVLSVIPFETVDEAISIANHSMYGLGGAVWSRDEEKALAIAQRLRAGTVWINEYHILNEKAPFGGYKLSGIGREFGIDGLMEYMEAKHIYIDEAKTREKKFWYDTVIPQG